MKKTLLFWFVLLLYHAQAQQGDCVLKPPLINITFGAGADRQDINAGALINYRRNYSVCPNDGFYAIVPSTQDCFNGTWITLPEDHTPGDKEGNMMLVNASYSRGIFLRATLSGLSENRKYQFGAWMLNVCRIRTDCPPLPPDITIILQTPAGRKVAEFNTGLLSQTEQPHWKKYVGFFMMPAHETALVLLMEDKIPGGCGNDFALDDITISECVKPVPPPADKIKPAKPEIKKATPPLQKKKEPARPPAKINRIEPAEPVPTLPEPAPKKETVPVVPPPPVLSARSNPIVKTLLVDEGTVTINLYDNGTIDGDTVSIYHNNELIVSRAGLSQKPISFKITVDATHPHHELVMVAENLGSIPPNTSLMIISVNYKRYEAFISSSEQKNAKVVLDLQRIEQ